MGTIFSLCLRARECRSREFAADHEGLGAYTEPGLQEVAVARIRQKWVASMVLSPPMALFFSIPFFYILRLNTTFPRSKCVRDFFSFHFGSDFACLRIVEVFFRVEVIDFGGSCTRTCSSLTATAVFFGDMRCKGL